MASETDHTSPLVQTTGLFSPDQVKHLEGLLSNLRPEQALWLSGYLAALGQPTGGVARATPASQAESGSGSGFELTVLYGTETGNAEGVAELLVQRAKARGLNARAADMAKFRPKNLGKARHIALVSATHGEGDPPDPAIGFFEFLAGRKAPKLDGSRYAVLSLGDSSYVEFCKAGRDLDERFEALGAERLLARVDCDVDYHDDADDWIERLVEVLAAEAEELGGDDLGTAPGEAPSAVGAPAPGIFQVLMGSGPGVVQAAGGPMGNGSEYSRRNPFPAEILDTTLLTGLHSDKETLHLELSLEDSGLAFEPGDSLGVVPENEDAVLEKVLEALDASPSDRVEVGGEDRELGEALKHDLELTLLTPGFLSKYAEVAAAKDLQLLLDAEDRDELLRFMKCHQVHDILAQFPVEGLEPQAFVDMLRKLQPRLYSIASSQKWIPDQVDLTVAVTRYTADGKERNGVASTFLAERKSPGEQVEVYVDRNKAFKLPSDPDVPVIMIGAGTGVAPYRAFMQEREEIGAGGRNWLFFGERRFREDFLYQTEWQRFLDDGLLTRMDVAFSRDQREKVYVQHRLRERAADVYSWLEDGAYLYVCGDAEGMAPGAEQALLEIVRDEGGRSEEAAEVYLREMRTDRRYQRDVY